MAFFSYTAQILRSRVTNTMQSSDQKF
ncbi:hypothetical protein AZE42_12674, partial [Rhizopogon vesiculosus]